MNESKQEPEVPSNETSEKKISNHEKMLESKVPQGIEESLGFSSVSTNLTDARQIVLFTLETLGEPGNPACDLLASALKVLNKALHTINEEVSTMAAQEPSDVLGCEGVVTQSPSDTLDTKETHNVQDSVVTESQCNAVTTQETPNAVDGIESPCDAVATLETPNIVDRVVNESLCDAVATQETPHVVDGVVTESPPCDAVATQETPNVVDGVVSELPCDAVATLETPNIAIVDRVITEYVCDAVATQEAPNVLDGVVSESPCDAVATQETPHVVDGVVTESPPCDAVATQETPNIVNGMVTESPCDALATQETPDVVDVVVGEFPCDAVATQETPNVVDGVVTEFPCDAVATQETPNVVDGVVSESSCDAVATQETPNVADGVVSESLYDAVAAQETLNVVEGVVSESLCDSVATQETSNVVDGVVTESQCDAVATQETPNIVDGVVSESPCDALATLETPNVVDGVVTESPCDALATQETSNVVDGVVSESPCDVLATQEIPDVADGVITESPCDAVATQETPEGVDVVVTEPSCDVLCEGSEIIASSCNVNVVSEPLVRVQALSEQNIKLPVETGSSMFVHEPAESLTEDWKSHIIASGINTSIHDVSAASGVGESTEVEGNFSNNSLRSRKRRCISDNSIEPCKHRSRNCSKIWEPLRKSRRLSENTASLCQRAEAIATYGRTEIVASLNKKGVVTESVGDALATQEIPDVEDGVIRESPCDAVATQETPEAEDVVVTESPCDAVSEEGEIIASTSNVNMASEPSMGVQSFSEDNINLTVERGSSLFVHEPAESFTEDGTTNITASEFNDVSAASTMTEFSESNATLRMKTDYVFAFDIHESSEAIDVELILCSFLSNIFGWYRWR